MTSFVHPDPEIQQLKIGVGAVRAQCRIVHLEVIGKQINGIALLKSDNGIVVERSLAFVLAEYAGAHISRSRLQSKAVRRTDGRKIVFEGGRHLLLVAAATFAGKRKGDHSDHHGADPRFAYPLFHSYGF
jgi:hypothetical protein